jgi:PIN domain nuclease of toxin-antitoxin system
MKFLLDTHILIWGLQENERLSHQIKELIDNEDNEIYISAASIWEIAIKSSLNKLNLSADEIVAALQDSDYLQLPITFGHTAKTAHLPHHHNDPFDRILIAQALVENLTLVTHDEKIKKYDVSLLST